MKKIVLIVFITLWTMVTSAQPRPFEIDQSFIPTLEYMQKSWTGDYDGLEPNSRMIISIKRSLVLNADFSYSNEVRGQVNNESEEILLKLETGTYQYDLGSQLITYFIEIDSTFDINCFLQGKDVGYMVNHYKQDGTEKSATEKAQFTQAAYDAARQWVLFDSQLMSPIDPRQKAVYVMSGKELEPTDIEPLHQRASDPNGIYDMLGRRLSQSPSRSLYIIVDSKGVRKIR